MSQIPAIKEKILLSIGTNTWVDKIKGKNTN